MAHLHIKEKKILIKKNLILNFLAQNAWKTLEMSCLEKISDIKFVVWTRLNISDESEPTFWASQAKLFDEAG